MTRRLTEHGKGAALVIDDSLLELLGIDFDTDLEVVTDGKRLIVSPLQTNQPGEELLASLERVNLAHHTTLKKLAQ